MFGWLWSMLDWCRGLFWKEEMEVTLVGLQNSGKTTLVNVLAVWNYLKSNFLYVRMVSLPRIWFPLLGLTWERWQKAGLLWKYGISEASQDSDPCGKDTVVVLTPLCIYFPIILIYSCRFVVDAADHSKLEQARNELRNLLERPMLQGIPVLVLGNKNDLSNALSAEQLIEKL